MKELLKKYKKAVVNGIASVLAFAVIYFNQEVPFTPEQIYAGVLVGVGWISMVLARNEE